MKMKKILKVIKNVICSIFTCISVFVTGIFIKEIINNDSDKKNSEELKDEIKNTSAADVINDSPNKDNISATIEQQQQELRERVRERLRKKL